MPGRGARRSRLLLLVLLQIYLGALVAGLHAGLIYNTWPLIDGSIIPSRSGCSSTSPLWRNFFENLLTVQFQHRMVAYTLWLLALLHLIGLCTRAQSAGDRRGAGRCSSLVTLQATLGIVTLLHQAPISLSLAHQGLAMIVLSVACFHAARMMRYQRVMIADAQASGQRLIEVGDDVFLVLEADRQPHHVRTGAGLHLLRVGKLAMGGRGGMDDQRARVADIGEMREQLARWRRA